MQIKKYLPYFTVIAGILLCNASFAQTPVEGYVFENNNRGYLPQVSITVYKFPGNVARTTTLTDFYGHFGLVLPAGKYRILTHKDMFDDRQDTILVQNEKIFLKVEMSRHQGYLLDAVLTETGKSTDAALDTVEKANIEIYNRTLDQSELELKKYKQSRFRFPFEQGNHYMILIRKAGYISKRIEVDVNTNGCVLCINREYDFDEKAPNDVTIDYPNHRIDAHLNMEHAIKGKKIGFPTLYMINEDGSFPKDIARQLDKVILMMQDNPVLSIEIGSHTDSRGNDEYNLDLSQKRANAAMSYLIGGGIAPERMTAKGYGETQLLNKCSNDVECTEAEHRENNRIELTLTSVGTGDMREEQFWMRMDQIIEEEKIAERTKAETARKSKPGLGQTEKEQLPEANNSVELPEFKGNIKDEIGEKEKTGSSGAPIRRNEAVQPKAIAQTTKLSPLDSAYTGFAIQLLRTSGEMKAEHPVFKSLKQVYWKKEFDGMYYYYILPEDPLDQMRKYYRKTIKPNHREARLLRFDTNGKVYLK